MEKDCFAYFTESLMKWYHPSLRPMPWKAINNPYYIWVSEVILQQTQVVQGTAYYNAFIKKFPDIQSLSNASESEVLKAWQGLGYYRRAINLHQGAKQIIELYDGKLPEDYNQLVKIKGIGSYTAAAIASFAFGLPHAVLDGNVFRILARFLGINEPMDSTAGKKRFSEYANSLLDRKDPATFNQAIMDLGALICTPKKPLCSDCPISLKCHAFQTSTIDDFPVKTRKPVKKVRHLNYLVLKSNGKYMMRRRSADDIFKNMYEYIPIDQQDKNRLAAKYKLSFNNSRKYILTHQILWVSYAELELVKDEFDADGQWFLNEEILNLPVPAFINDIINVTLKK